MMSKKRSKIKNPAAFTNGAFNIIRKPFYFLRWSLTGLRSFLNWLLKAERSLLCWMTF